MHSRTTADYCLLYFLLTIKLYITANRVVTTKTKAKIPHINGPDADAAIQIKNSMILNKNNIVKSQALTIAHVDIIAAVSPSRILLSIPSECKLSLFTFTAALFVNTFPIFIRIAEVLCLSTQFQRQAGNFLHTVAIPAHVERMKISDKKTKASKAQGWIHFTPYHTSLLGICFGGLVW